MAPLRKSYPTTAPASLARPRRLLQTIWRETVAHGGAVSTREPGRTQGRGTEEGSTNAAVLGFQKEEWDVHLPKALRILRSRKNRATGMTPAKALLGYKLPRRGEWEISEYDKQRNAQRQTAKDTAARRRIIRARQMDFNEKEYPGQHADPPVTFRRGEMVMVRETNPAGPFEPVWSGPHPITKRWSPHVFEVDKNGRIFKHHIDQLRPTPVGNQEWPEDQDHPFH